MLSQIVNGVRYGYQVQGHGPPLVLLHGFRGSQANWQPLLPALSAHFQVIAIDLLGHGRTGTPADPERYHMERVAQDVAALVTAVTPEPVHLLGYSMGGRLALYLSARPSEHHLRIKSLILESASPGLETVAEREARVRQDEALAARIERDGIPAFVAYWEQIPLFASQRALPEEARLALRRQRLQNVPLGLANSLRGMGTGRQPSLWPELAGIDLPVLLLTGELDTKFVAIGRRMAVLLPRAEHVVLPEAGHTIHLERPSAFAERVLAFLQR